MIYPLPDEWYKRIGLNIKTRRKSLHFSQEKLAELLNISARSVIRHEHGYGITIYMITFYAEALGCSPVMLLFDHVDVKDPLFASFMKIKGFQEDAQELFLHNIENLFILANMIKE